MESVKSLSIVESSQAPKPIGHYVQAVRCGDTLYLSGQIGLDPATGELRLGFEEQVEQVLANLRAVCAAQGAGLERIVRLSIYLLDLNRFAAVNAAMARHFGDWRPARSTLGVSELPKGAQIEIDAVVWLGD